MRGAKGATLSAAADKFGISERTVTLLADRAVYADVRFYFDCARVFAGRGGNVGLVTPDVFKASTRAILDKWGTAVSFKKLPFQKNREVAAVKIAVSRTNKTAQK